MYAARTAGVELVPLLQASGADLNVTTKGGHHLLAEAAMHGDRELVTRRATRGR